MNIEDLENNTCLSNLNAVWDIWGNLLPVVWDTRLGHLTVILTPPDDAGKVMVALPPKRYMIASLSDLVEIKPGTIVVLDDARRGWIRTYKAYSTFCFFEDEKDGQHTMVGMSQIIRAQPDTNKKENIA